MSPLPEASSRNPRLYVAGEKYILPVDDEERDRLDHQHKVLKSAFSNQLLFVPHQKDSSYFILESGVGTGAWLIDIASELSKSSILHGIDIDISRLPGGYPYNVSFSLCSVLSLPDAWSARFDIVHQRLLTYALTYTDWQKALQQIYRVLRPGGWVQVGEFGRADADEAFTDPVGRPATNAWRQLQRALIEHEGLLFRPYKNLPVLLREAGFEDIRIEHRRMPLGAWEGELGRNAAKNAIVFYHALKNRILGAGDLGIINSEAELDRMIDAVQQEWDTTPGAGTDFFIMCAKKPE